MWLSGNMQALQANPGLRPKAVSLASPLAKLVEEGASKLAQRTTGVSALLACCYIAAASREADGIFKQHKVKLFPAFSCFTTPAFVHHLWCCVQPRAP